VLKRASKSTGGIYPASFKVKNYDDSAFNYMNAPQADHLFLAASIRSTMPPRRAHPSPTGSSLASATMPGARRRASPMAMARIRATPMTMPGAGSPAPTRCRAPPRCSTCTIPAMAGAW
jgi:hypothetical protein